MGRLFSNVRLHVSLSVAITSMCNTCTLAFHRLVHQFISVVKISCGCYVFVIFLSVFSCIPFFRCRSILLPLLPLLSMKSSTLFFLLPQMHFYTFRKISFTSQRIRITILHCWFCWLSFFSCMYGKKRRKCCNWVHRVHSCGENDDSMLGLTALMRPNADTIPSKHNKPQHFVFFYGIVTRCISKKKRKKERRRQWWWFLFIVKEQKWCIPLNLHTLLY